MGAPKRDPIAETFTAEGAITDKAYYIFKAGTAADQIKISAVAGEKVLGVIPQSGKNVLDTAPADLETGGGGKVLIGAAVAYDDFLMNDTAGKAITATTGKYYFGRARSSGSKADVVIDFVHEKGYLP